MAAGNLTKRSFLWYNVVGWLVVVVGMLSSTFERKEQL